MLATLGLSVLALAVTSVATGQPASLRSGIARAVAATSRTPANVARDPYRHPTETLAFFGVKATDTVVELVPGGGWYTEILAPYLAQRGTYYAAGGWARGLANIKAMQAANPAAYGKVRLAAFPAGAGEPTASAPVR